MKQIKGAVFGSNLPFNVLFLWIINYDYECPWKYSFSSRLTLSFGHTTDTGPGFCVNKELLWMSRIDFYLFRVGSIRFWVDSNSLQSSYYQYSRILLYDRYFTILSNLTGISTLRLLANNSGPLLTQTVGVVSSSQPRDSDLEGGELISLFDGN